MSSRLSLLVLLLGAFPAFGDPPAPITAGPVTQAGPPITADVGSAHKVSRTGLPELRLNRGRYTILYCESVKPDVAVTWAVNPPDDADAAALWGKHVYSLEFVPPKKDDKVGPFPGWGWKEGELRSDKFKLRTDLTDALFLAVREDETGKPLDPSRELRFLVTNSVTDMTNPARPKSREIGRLVVVIPVVGEPEPVVPGPKPPGPKPPVPVPVPTGLEATIRAALGTDIAAGANPVLAASPTKDLPDESANLRLSRVYASAATLVTRTDPASSPPKTVGELLTRMNQMSTVAELPEKPALKAVREAIQKALIDAKMTPTSKVLTTADRDMLENMFGTIAKALGS